MDCGEILRQLRKDRKLSQKDVAKLLNTDTSYYGKYEREERPLPIWHLVTLCRFYNVSADYILGLPDLPYPKD